MKEYNRGRCRPCFRLTAKDAENIGDIFIFPCLFEKCKKKKLSTFFFFKWIKNKSFSFVACTSNNNTISLWTVWIKFAFIYTHTHTGTDTHSDTRPQRNSFSEESLLPICSISFTLRSLSANTFEWQWRCASLTGSLSMGWIKCDLEALLGKHCIKQLRWRSGCRIWVFRKPLGRHCVATPWCQPEDDKDVSGCVCSGTDRPKQSVEPHARSVNRYMQIYSSKNTPGWEVCVQRRSRLKAGFHHDLAWSVERGGRAVANGKAASSPALYNSVSQSRAVAQLSFPQLGSFQWTIGSLKSRA